MSIEDRYNTFLGRFFSGIIDGLVILPLLFLDFIFLKPDNSLTIVIPWLIVSYSIFYTYSVFFHWKTGQTIGKKIMKVQVIDISEKGKLSFKQAVLRDSAYILLQLMAVGFLAYNVINLGTYDMTNQLILNSTNIIDYIGLGWFLLEILTMLTNKKRRALHDFIAGTVVINKTMHNKS